MKKYIWTIAASIMIAGVITIVACSKDNETEQSINPTFSSTKGGTTINQLRNVMVAYYAACDSAYQADSTTFLSICANNDTTNFYKVTGISAEMLSTYRTLALQEYEEFLKDNPNFKPDDTPCLSCINDALPRLGTILSLTSGHIANVFSENIGNNTRSHLANSIYKCHQTKPFDMPICLSSSVGEKFLLLSIRKSLDSAICELNNLCNIAYQKDSIALLQICENNDTSAFYILTGVSKSLLSEIVMFADKGIDVFMQLNPDYQFDNKPCTSCGYYALPRYGEQLWITHGHLPASYEYYFYPIDSWDCTRTCYENNSTYEDRAYCIAQCENYLMLRDDNLIMY